MNNLWWKLKKIVDDEERIVYSYSRESDLLDGEIEYNKNTEKMICVKLSSNDTEKGVERLYTHVFKVIIKENAPDEKFIAIG